MHAGAQRLLAHHTSKKEPITVSRLDQLVNSKALSMATLCDIRSVLICLLSFAAFLRFHELAKVVRSDVELDSEKFQLFIECSKTDKYRDGVLVVVAVSGKVTCPVNMMNQYLFFASYLGLNLVIKPELEVLATLGSEN